MHCQMQETPLHKAAMAGRESNVKKLLEMGVCVRMQHDCMCMFAELNLSTSNVMSYCTTEAKPLYPFASRNLDNTITGSCASPVDVGPAGHACKD